MISVTITFLGGTNDQRKLFLPTTMPDVVELAERDTRPILPLWKLAKAPTRDDMVKIERYLVDWVRREAVFIS